MPTSVHFKDTVDRLQAVLKASGDGIHRALWQVAAEVDDEHGIELGELHLIDGRFPGIFGQFGLGLVHALPHVDQRFVNIHVRLEFQGDGRPVLGG